MPLQSVSNKVNGVAGWDKSVVDINNIDETFANARDLGYSRLNNTRISVIGRLGKYDDRDLYRVQVQSNGKIFLNLRTGSEESEKVLDLSKHEAPSFEGAFFVSKCKMPHTKALFFYYLQRQNFSLKA